MEHLGGEGSLGAPSYAPSDFESDDGVDVSLDSPPTSPPRPPVVDESVLPSPELQRKLADVSAVETTASDDSGSGVGVGGAGHDRGGAIGRGGGGGRGAGGGSRPDMFDLSNETEAVSGGNGTASYHTADDGTNGGRIDHASATATSGLTLDLDGLSGFSPYPPGDDRSDQKFDEARLTKSSIGSYPVQSLSTLAGKGRGGDAAHDRPAAGAAAGTARMSSLSRSDSGSTSSEEEDVPNFLRKAAAANGSSKGESASGGGKNRKKPESPLVGIPYAPSAGGSTVGSAAGSAVGSAAGSAVGSAAGSALGSSTKSHTGRSDSAGSSLVSGGASGAAGFDDATATKAANGAAAARARRRRPRPWDSDVKEDDSSYLSMEDGRHLSVSMQRTSSTTTPPAAAVGKLKVDDEATEPSEDTPLLSNRARGRVGGGGPGGRRSPPPPPASAAASRAAAASDFARDCFADGVDGSKAGSGGGGSQTNSWSTGASMRFRNPLRRAPPSGSDHLGSAPNGSAAGGGDFKWRGGSLQPASSGIHGRTDGDEEDWTVGSVVREFFRPPWRRNRSSSSGAGSNGGAGGQSDGYGALGGEQQQLGQDDGSGSRSTFASAYASRPQDRATFSTALSILTVLHFIVMGLYDLYWLYRSWGGSSSEDGGSSMWPSKSGLVANPLLGPPASTLTLFGALSGIRITYQSELWRVLTSLTLSTSLVQLLVNLHSLGYLRCGMNAGYIPGLERRWLSRPTLALYCICATCGAACAIASDYPADVTGLTGAGLCGLLAASLAEGWLSGVREWRSDRLDLDDNGGVDGVGGVGSSALAKYGPKRRGLLKVLLRPSRAHLLLALQFGVGLASAHASLLSAVGGAVAGLGCGLFHFAYLLGAGKNNGGRRDGGGGLVGCCGVLLPCFHRRGRRNDADRGGGHGSGSAFSTPRRKTPGRRGGGSMLFGTPPDSHSSPAETPPMRRSILASPDGRDDDPDHGMGYGGAGDPTSPMMGDASSPYRTPGQSFLSRFSSTPPDDDDDGGVGCGRTRAAASPGVTAVRLAGFVLAAAVALVPVALLAASSSSSGTLSLDGAQGGGSGSGSSLEERLLAESRGGCRTMRHIVTASAVSPSSDNGSGGSSSSSSSAGWTSDEEGNVWVCAQSCVPTSLGGRAARSMSRGGMGMREGWCPDLDYRCLAGSGTATLTGGGGVFGGGGGVLGVLGPLMEFDLDLDLYRLPDGEGTCGTEDGEGVVEAGDDDGDGQQQQQQQQQRRQANGYGMTRDEIKQDIKDVATEILEEVVENAGI